jgi:hypothetical protein
MVTVRIILNFWRVWQRSSSHLASRFFLDEIGASARRWPSFFLVGLTLAGA